MDYNYYEAVTEDVMEYIKDEIDIEDFSSRASLTDYLYDTLFVEDSVTGNASGSYWFNSYKAEEAICHNLDLAKEAYAEFGSVPDLNNPEAVDVTIRCYLLSQAIEEALDNLDIDF